MWDQFLRDNPGAYGFGQRAHVQASPETGGEVVKTGLIAIRSLIRKSPSIELSIIAGEINHQLRSALDHLVYQLVLEAGGTPHGRNAFPIYDDERQFIGQVERRRRSTDRPGPLSGLDPRSEAWALIKRAQPYQRGDCADNLTLLRDFSNADKHRELWAFAAYPEPDDLEKLVHWNPDAILLEKDFRFQPGDPFEDETVVMSLRFDPHGPESNVDVRGQLPLEIAFTDGNPETTHSGSLAGAYTCVAKIVADAAAHFR